MTHEILEGIRVVEMGIAQMGPVCTMMLASMGAEVIKVERPEAPMAMPDGNLRGSEGKGSFDGPLSAFHEFNNRHKKSITLDLTRPKALEVFYQLITKSDVFVHNMRQGVGARHGWDYQTLKKYNPQLIYCNLSAFGTKGPDAQKGGFEPSGVARSGWMYMTGTESDDPVYALQGPFASDQIGAIFGSYAVVAALLARERFGIGQEIESSQFSACMWLLGEYIQRLYYTGAPPVILEPRKRSHFALAGNYYKCADGKWLMLISPNPRQWVPLCQALGIPESIYKDDPRFNTPMVRRDKPGELVTVLDEYFARKTLAEHIKSFEGKDIFWERVQKPADLENDPQVIANKYLTDYTHPLTGQTYKYQNLPMQFGETPVARQGRAPLLGEHTEEILVNLLGYKKKDLPKLLDEIGRPVPPVPWS
jgi:crotonobetainyl-CoA:carnitine CoA-transferase CaiB-like acyl-CoA transferase